jgi:thioesterase domain-containing protein
VSAAALLSELRRRDIQLRAEGSELRCSAPAGALTAELHEQLREHKGELLALLASAEILAGQGRAIVPLQGKGIGTPIFGVPGHNGDVFCYRILSQWLGQEQPFYGLQPPGLYAEEIPLARVEHLATYFADQIAQLHRNEPCIVAGFCAGGTVALELARELVNRGTPVRFLALFGCPYPTYFTRHSQLRLALMRILRAGCDLAVRSASDRRAYLAAKLVARRRRRALKRDAASDPVLMRRTNVERATLAAVRQHSPRHFRGRVNLFLPGPEWRRSGVAVERWGTVAAEVREYFGPDASDGADMLREVHAPAFAQLFRRACSDCD